MYVPTDLDDTISPSRLSCLQPQTQTVQLQRNWSTLMKTMSMSMIIFRKTSRAKSRKILIPETLFFMTTEYAKDETGLFEDVQDFVSGVLKAKIY